MLNTATKHLEVEVGLKCLIDLRKELISLWNLTKVLRFSTNVTTEIRTQYLASQLSPFQRVPLVSLPFSRSHGRFFISHGFTNFKGTLMQI